jgi:hypothetical protein
MNNQYTNSSSHNKFTYTQEQSLAHHQSIPLNTVLKVVNGIATTSYPKNPISIPQATRVVEKKSAILQ